MTILKLFSTEHLNTKLKQRLLEKGVPKSVSYHPSAVGHSSIKEEGKQRYVVVEPPYSSQPADGLDSFGHGIQMIRFNVLG